MTCLYVDRQKRRVDGVPVRAVVDDDGRLVELVLSRELLAQQPWAVSRAIVAAVNEVQDAVRVRPDGWVELRRRHHPPTHPPEAWNGTAGANLLASADDEAIVRRPNTVLQTYRFGVEVGPPTGTPGGAVQPGRITIYGLLPHSL